MNNNLLITGAAGFIGANFLYFWLNKKPNANLTVVDKLTYAGNLATIKPLIDSNRVAFYQADIGDKSAISNILSQHKIDTIVNFAAESHVDRSISSPDSFITTNVNGTLNLLNCAKDYWLEKKNFLNEHRFHHVSTDEVYGSLKPDAPAFTEQTPYQPNSPYAATKAASDHLVRAYHETYGLNTSISNCSNNYGKYHFPEKLIPLTITRILRGERIPVYGDGHQIRDWLHVDDHCKAIELIICKGTNGETYNVGGNNELTNIELVHYICNTMNEAFKNTPALINKYPKAISAAKSHSESLIKYVDDRLGHDRRYAVNANKIKKELGFEPSPNFQKLLQETVYWYLNNPSWWEPLLK
jgi:dTDP-glucose 4,6-dehydratase